MLRLAIDEGLTQMLHKNFLTKPHGQSKPQIFRQVCMEGMTVVKIHILLTKKTKIKKPRKEREEQLHPVGCKKFEYFASLTKS